MDTLFENDYERTPEITGEIYRYLCFKRPVHIVSYAVLGALVIWNIVAAICFWEFAIPPVTYVCLFMLIQIFRYGRSVSIARGRDRELYGSEQIKVRMVVTEEGIGCIYNEKEVKPIALSNIKKVYKTKNLIVLITNAQLLLVFHRNKFTVGSQENFLEYLRENGIKV